MFSLGPIYAATLKVREEMEDIFNNDRSCDVHVRFGFRFPKTAHGELFY